VTCFSGGRWSWQVAKTCFKVRLKGLRQSRKPQSDDSACRNWNTRQISVEISERNDNKDIDDSAGDI
jgi:hypothetical protein